MKKIVDEYYATEDGKVLHGSKELHGSVDTNGYVQVTINGVKYRVHRLIAAAFIPNPLALSQVNHKDGNKLNNSVENLEWSSARENVIHAYQNHLQGFKSTDRPNKRVRCIETGEEYPSIQEATRSLGHNSCGPLWKCLHGYTGVPTAFGYHWCFTNPAK